MLNPHFRAVKYIKSCLCYEGGFSVAPGMEAHGGSTYCALAALRLMGREDDLTPRQHRDLVRWCTARLAAETASSSLPGFCGRPNKPADTCYTFWVGGALALLNPDFGDGGLKAFLGRARDFVLATHDMPRGGLSKWPDNGSDPLHTYLGLAGLSLAGEEGVAEVDPAVNIAREALML